MHYIRELNIETSGLVRRSELTTSPQCHADMDQALTGPEMPTCTSAGSSTHAGEL